MCAPVGVIFYALDDMLARQVALVVDNAYAPLVTATAVSHCDPPGVVPSSQVLSLSGNGELEVRSSLPQVVIDGALKMAQSGCAGFVCTQRDKSVSPRAFLFECSSIDSHGGLYG